MSILTSPWCFLAVPEIAAPLLLHLAIALACKAGEIGKQQGTVREQTVNSN